MQPGFFVPAKSEFTQAQARHKQMDMIEGVAFSHWIRVVESDRIDDVVVPGHSIVLYPNPTKS